MSEPVFPPSVGTLSRESRMDFDVDAFARLAHDMYDQPSLEKTLEKIVESAVSVLGCDYAGLLITSKSHQLIAITASDPAAEKADKLQIDAGRPRNCRGRRARTTVGTTQPRTCAGPAGRPGCETSVWKCAGGPVGPPANAGIELVCRSPRWFDATLSPAAEAWFMPRSRCPPRDKESCGRPSTHARSGRAQGILMERFVIDDQAALRSASPPQNTNTKLNEVARIRSLGSPAQILTTLRGGLPARCPAGSAPLDDRCEGVDFPGSMRRRPGGERC
jgi:hypothetical protein